MDHSTPSWFGSVAHLKLFLVPNEKKLKSVSTIKVKQRAFSSVTIKEKRRASLFRSIRFLTRM